MGGASSSRWLDGARREERLCLPSDEGHNSDNQEQCPPRELGLKEFTGQWFGTMPRSWEPGSDQDQEEHRGYDDEGGPHNAERREDVNCNI